MNPPTNWTSSKATDIEAAITGSLKVFGRQAILMPTLPTTYDINTEFVNPSARTVAQILRYLSQTGNYFLHDRGTHMGLDLTHVDENGKFFCFTYDYKPFQSALEKELIFVSFVPGSESALEQRLGLTVKEVTSILYAAKTSSELKVITQQEVQKLRQEREKPIWELNKAAARPVDPANISNAKYLQAGIDVVAVSTTA